MSNKTETEPGGVNLPQDFCFYREETVFAWDIWGTTRDGRTTGYVCLRLFFSLGPLIHS